MGTAEHFIKDFRPGGSIGNLSGQLQQGHGVSVPAPGFELESDPAFIAGGREVPVWFAPLGAGHDDLWIGEGGQQTVHPRARISRHQARAAAHGAGLRVSCSITGFAAPPSANSVVAG